MCSSKPVVLKFGGSALAAPASIATALRIAREQSRAWTGDRRRLGPRGSHRYSRSQHRRGTRRAISTSHVSRRPWVSDTVLLLVATTSGPARRQAEAAVSEKLTSLREQLQGLQGARTVAPAARAMILATGERLMAPVFVAGLRCLGLTVELVDGAEIIRTDDAFGGADVDTEMTRALVTSRMEALLEGTSSRRRPGFVGSTPVGATTLLGRGGSDLTATLLGWARGALREWRSGPTSTDCSPPTRVRSSPPGCSPSSRGQRLRPSLAAAPESFTPTRWNQPHAGASPSSSATSWHQRFLEAPSAITGAACQTPARALASTADDKLARIFVLVGHCIGSRLLGAAGARSGGPSSPRHRGTSRTASLVTVPVASHGPALRLLHSLLS